jgi:hypothetical protein
MGARDIGANLDRYGQRMEAAIYALLEAHSAKAEGKAKNPPYPLRPLRKDEMKGRKKKTIKPGTLEKMKARRANSKPAKQLSYQELNGGETHLKWRDQTSLARGSIFHEVTKTDDGKLLGRVSHTMEYGVYLELAKQRVYATIEPAVKEQAPQFVEAVKRLVSK